MIGVLVLPILYLFIIILMEFLNYELSTIFTMYHSIIYRIIPNKRTPPNKHAAPPPVFHVPCIPRKSAGLKKSTRHQSSACRHGNIVEPRSMCCERGCKRGILSHVA